MAAPKLILDLVDVFRRNREKYRSPTEYNETQCRLEFIKFHRLPNRPAFARDVSGIGHWGMGDLELGVTNAQQLTDAEPLIRQSFDHA